MEILSYGYKKPVNGDTGDVFFPALEENIQKQNDHTHDGVNSAFIASQSPSAMINLYSPAARGAVTDQANPYFGRSFVFSQGAEQVAIGFLKIFNKYTKMSISQGILIIPFYCDNITQSIKFQLTTKLIKDGAAVSSSININSDSLEVLLDSPANQLRLLKIPFTSLTGKINLLAIENGDSLFFELKRVFPTAAEAADDVIIKSDFIEVLI